MLAISPGTAHFVLGLEVGLKISKDKEGILAAQVVHQRAEELRIAIAEVALLDQMQHILEFRQLVE